MPWPLALRRALSPHRVLRRRQSTPTVPRRTSRTPLARVRRRVRLHHRAITVTVLALVAFAVVDALSPPAARTVPVLVTSRQLGAGAVLGPGDVTVARWPPAVTPAGSLISPDDAVGRRVAGPMGSGEPVTGARLVGSGLVDAAPAGRVAVPVRLTDPGAAAVLRPGDEVDLVAGADPDGFTPATARTVARGAVVLAVPGAAAEADRGLGAIGTGDAGAGGSMVVVAVPRAEAADLAGIPGSRWLGIVITSGGSQR